MSQRLSTGALAGVSLTVLSPLPTRFLIPLAAHQRHRPLFSPPAFYQLPCKPFDSSYDLALGATSSSGSVPCTASERILCDSNCARTQHRTNRTYSNEQFQGAECRAGSDVDLEFWSRLGERLLDVERPLLVVRLFPDNVPVGNLAYGDRLLRTALGHWSGDLCFFGPRFPAGFRGLLGGGHCSLPLGSNGWTFRRFNSVPFTEPERQDHARDVEREVNDVFNERVNLIRLQ